MRIKRCLCAALFAFATQACISQTITPDITTTSGGYYSNASASLSWTVGEPLIETGAYQTTFLTQGFQQPTSILISRVNDNTTNPKGNVAAYPNPATSSVFITSTSNQALRVDVMDAAGRKLFSKSFPSSDDNEVNMSGYSIGVYFFRVYSTDGQLLQTLKIEKIK